MDCYICPKRCLCSGADCYYDYHPEPSKELAGDKAQLEDLERSGRNGR